MSKFWVHLKHPPRNYCMIGNDSKCHQARLFDAPDEPDHHIRSATEEINRILSRLEQDHAGPDRALAFLVVPVGEDDILRLDWINLDDEVVTYDVGNY